MVSGLLYIIWVGSVKTLVRVIAEVKLRLKLKLMWKCFLYELSQIAVKESPYQLKLPM